MQNLQFLKFLFNNYSERIIFLYKMRIVFNSRGSRGLHTFCSLYLPSFSSKRILILGRFNMLYDLCWYICKLF